MKQKQLPSDELAFHSLSFCDYNGRLFKWQGNLYRAIPTEQTPLYQDLFERGIVEDLVAKKLLVETQLTSLTVENYDLILEHRRIGFVSYPREWCDEMLKDAALLHLDLCLELDRHNLTTADAHPLNILFDGCQPVFIDFGSIDCFNIADSYWLWSPYEQFCSCFLNPLRLMAQGQGRIARWLLHDYERGVTSSDVEALNPQPRSLLTKVREKINRFKTNIRDRTRSLLFPSVKPLTYRDFLEQIHQEVGSINLPSITESEDLVNWQNPEPSGSLDAKLLTVDSLLSTIQPDSVLEIGNNYSQGSYSQLAAEKSIPAVFLTAKEGYVKQLYLYGREKQLSILPLIMDFASPSCDLANAWFAPARDRLSCDLVLAIDLIDWLVFKRYLPFDAIIERLSTFSKRWLLIEFTIRQPPYRASWSSDVASRFSWYELDNFVDLLNQKFSKVEALKRFPHSVLFLCTK